MDKKPVIGIVSKPSKFDGNELFKNQVIYEPVRCAVLKNGGLPIGILPTQATQSFYEDEFEIDKTILSDEELNGLHNIVDRCDGVILQGGLSSASYEYAVAKYAIEKNIPLLGICAGFNNIVRAMGGDVFLGDNISRHNIEDGSIAHRIIIKEGSVLHGILGEIEADVNSIHTFFAKEEDINGLEISAYSDDGFVEAVELKNRRFCLGVKWHPELMLDDIKMKRIFEEFIKVCGNC